MIFSELELDYLYYLEFSLTVFQNYRITAFESFWLSPLKRQKVENEQKKQEATAKEKT